MEAYLDQTETTRGRNIKPLRTAGILLGFGMGGFVDGILFHQILQLHNMLSNIYFPDSLVNEQINMFWDGLFHAFTWTMTAAGIYFLWQTARAAPSRLNARVFVGSLALGWGFFNLAEGIIDHEILALHHVVQRTTGTLQLVGDLIFLGWGAALATVGYWLVQRGKKEIEDSD